MAFTTRAPRRNESSLSWQDALKKECYWQNELSFTNLKLNLKLVKNYHEWRSIQRSFRYKNVTTKNIIQWLRHQQSPFRTSYLHHLLISGYSRECNVSFCNLEYAPKDVQDIILSYTNLLFVKLYTKSRETLITFDCNLTITNLVAILKQDPDHNDCSDLRLWTRFDTIKFIYLVSQQYGSNKKVYTDSYHDKEGLEVDKDRARWVEIPRDHTKSLLFKDLDDKLEYHQVLEFGVDKFRKIYVDQRLGSVSRATVKTIKCSFKPNEEEKKDHDGGYNHFEFIQSLKIGDKIDVDIGQQWPWMSAYIFGRDYDTFYIRIEQASKYNIYPDWEITTIGIDNLGRLQRSNTRCQCSVESSIPLKVNNSNFVECEWMTAFNTASPFIHHPILFE